MKLVASCCPCRESAAKCRPAIQPSVRLSSAAMSWAERVSPIAWLRNPVASEWVKRKSATRSSVKWPPTRNLANGSAGSSRVAMTRCICGGRCSSRKGEGLVNRLGSNHVVVAQDEDELVLYGGNVIEQ